MSEFNTNKSELLQIADAVAREKLIEPQLVVEAMEDSLAKAAKSKYGSEYDIQAKIDLKTGLWVRAYLQDDRLIPFLDHDSP